MSATINLLPDTRIAKIKAKNLRHLVTGIAVALWIAAAILVGVLFGIIGSQTILIQNASSKITSDITSIKNLPNINDALSFQGK